MDTIRPREVTFNNAGDKDELVTVGVCRRITVKESPKNTGWPTTEWDWADAATGGNENRETFGGSKVFEKGNGPDGKPIFYGPVERVTFIETVTVASAVFSVVEEL